MDSPSYLFGNIRPTFTCVPISSLCKNRSKYVFWMNTTPQTVLMSSLQTSLSKKLGIFNWEKRQRGSSFRSTYRCSISTWFLVMTNATCYYCLWWYLHKKQVAVCSWVLTMSFLYNVLLWYWHTSMKKNDVVRFSKLGPLTC